MVVKSIVGGKTLVESIVWMDVLGGKRTCLVKLGLAQRLDWWDGENQFQVKWGVVYRLNKMVSGPFDIIIRFTRNTYLLQIIDNAIRVADATNPDVEEFQRFLFLMGMAAAHELVHAFVGAVTGGTDRSTPPPANFPHPGLRGGAGLGESGRYFEGVLCGFLVQAYHRDGHRLGVRQAGELVALTSDSNRRPTYYRLNRNWVLDCLRLGTLSFCLSGTSHSSIRL